MNEKKILEYVLRMLKRNELTRLRIECETLLTLSTVIPSYVWDESIVAICSEKEAREEC